MRRTRSRQLMLWCGCCALALPLVATAAPRLNALSPIGYQRGTKFTLVLAGQELGGEIEILSKIPGTIQLKPVDMVDGKPAYDEAQRRDFEVEIPADAEVGVYPVRIRTPDGVSNQLLFAVGTLPDVGEVEPNNSREQPQVVALGTTVLGSVAPADRDVYKLTLPAGTRLVAEVEARRLGMAMDSTVAVLDSSGHELAASDDAPGLDADSRVDVTLAHAGDYYVVVNDVNYQQNSTYRLKIGSYAYADGIFPLGGTGGAPSKVWTWTASQGSESPVVVDAPSAPWTMVQPMGKDSPALPLRFVVSRETELIEEPGKVVDLTSGQVVNGRISAPGEKDLYRLVTAPGQRWRLQLRGRQLGSAIDGVLAVENTEGVPYVRSVDQVDPQFDFVVPADVTEVRLAVEDLLGRGGPGYTYRLSAELIGSDFSLTVVPEVVNIPAETFEYVAVRADRRGYDGPIQLFVPEQVGGVTAEEGLIPAGQSEGYILLSALPGAGNRMLPLEIWGRGGSPSRPIDRKAAGSSVNSSPYVAAEVTDTMPAALCQGKPFRVDVANRRVRVVHGVGGKVDLVVHRGDQATEEVRIEPKIRIPSFPNGLETTIAKDQNAGAINFPGNVELGLSRGTMLFEAVSKVAGREVRVTLPPMNVALVRPFAMEVLSRSRSTPPAGEVKVDVVVRREAGFDQPVTLQVENLPKGVTSAPLTVAPGESMASIPLTISGAELGSYTLKVRASADIDGRKKQKTYDLPLEEIKLEVVAPPASS